MRALGWRQPRSVCEVIETEVAHAASAEILAYHRSPPKTSWKNLIGNIVGTDYNSVYDLRQEGTSR
jgi:hypothetical protein